MVKDGFKLLVAGGMAIIVILLFATMWVFGFGLFSTSTADYRGRVQQTEQIQANGAYRIAQYGYFFDQCASIQTLTEQIALTEGQIAVETDPVSRRDEMTNLTGQQFERAQAINQYNADSAKTDTAAHFKASRLPSHINQDDRSITCG